MLSQIENCSRTVLSRCCCLSPSSQESCLDPTNHTLETGHTAGRPKCNLHSSSVSFCLGCSFSYVASSISIFSPHSFVKCIKPAPQLSPPQHVLIYTVQYILLGVFFYFSLSRFGGCFMPQRSTSYAGWNSSGKKWNSLSSSYLFL